MGLKQLAESVWKLTRYMLWKGGKASDWKQHRRGEWPEQIKMNWNDDALWTLSPEAVLQGHRVRVCVASTRAMGDTHNVRVFIDDELKYPGGKYTEDDFVIGKRTFWWPFVRRKKTTTWSGQIAIQEHVDGGKDGPVYGRYRLIDEAEKKLSPEPADEPIEELEAMETEAFKRLQRAVVREKSC